MPRKRRSSDRPKKSAYRNRRARQIGAPTRAAGSHCPTPRKVHFRDKRAATNAAHAIEGGSGETLRVYACPCRGGWCLTSLLVPIDESHEFDRVRRSRTPKREG